jgi:hypothetical protein
MTRRPLDRSRSRLAELIAPAGYTVAREAALLHLIDSKGRERDAAYGDGYDQGDAELALGRAA